MEGRVQFPDTDAVGTGALAPVVGGSLLSAFAGAGLGLEVGKPFSEPIVLLERVRIAGTALVPNIGVVARDLVEGERLRLERDPLNVADAYAIKVLTPSGEGLGYLPADRTEILARLMDGGKLLFARVISSIGDMLLRGLTCLDDQGRARELFFEAYECGEFDRPSVRGSAALRLGTCYEEGIGCDPDYRMALSWYERAVEHLDSAVSLGNWFYNRSLQSVRDGVVRMRQELGI